MRTPTTTLRGLALNYVLAKCEKDKVSLRGDQLWLEGTDRYDLVRDRQRGGQILERERIDVLFNHDGPDAGQWTASAVAGFTRHGHRLRISCLGSSPLEAGLRCYVLRKKGKSINIPALILERTGL